MLYLYITYRWGELIIVRLAAKTARASSPSASAPSGIRHERANGVEAGSWRYSAPDKDFSKRENGLSTAAYRGRRASPSSWWPNIGWLGPTNMPPPSLAYMSEHHPLARAMGCLPWHAQAAQRFQIWPADVVGVVVPRCAKWASHCSCFCHLQPTRTTLGRLQWWDHQRRAAAAAACAMRRRAVGWSAVERLRSN